MSYGGGYSTTSYGAQGAADGGGFMGGSQGGSQTGAGKGTYGKDTLRPVTIKQTLDAEQPHPDAEFKIDDVEITQTTNITYKLDDGTGTMEVKQWVDADAGGGMDMGAGEDKPKAKMVENDWARVWGRLKSFNNKRHVVAHNIRPIEDKMDITYHLLESTFVHVYFTKGPLDRLKDEGGGSAAQNSYVATNGAAIGSNQPRLSPLARRILDTIKSAPENNEGLHVQNIAAMMGQNVDDVIKGGNELFELSLIYTTMNEETWQVMET